MTQKALRQDLRDKHSKVYCPNNCGREVVGEALSLHLKYDCPKRITKCSLCQKSMTVEELSFHKSKVCPKRVVRCTNEGCGTLHTFENINYHLKYTTTSSMNVAATWWSACLVVVIPC